MISCGSPGRGVPPSVRTGPMSASARRVPLAGNPDQYEWSSPRLGAEPNTCEMQKVIVQVCGRASYSEMGSFRYFWGSFFAGNPVKSFVSNRLACFSGVVSGRSGISNLSCFCGAGGDLFLLEGRCRAVTIEDAGKVWAMQPVGDPAAREAVRSHSSSTNKT